MSEVTPPPQTPRAPGAVARALRKDDGFGPVKKWPIWTTAAGLLFVWGIKIAAGFTLDVYDTVQGFKSATERIVKLEARDAIRERAFHTLCTKVEKLTVVVEKQNQLLEPLIRAKLLSHRVER